jgi:UDP-2,3-diacylglucosamine hydrolase
MTKSLFISDLHLHESRPLITRAFFNFLETKVKSADALYILGDFFDAWIGDDDDQPLISQVALALAKTADAGTKIYIMHGNRDFLIGEKFAHQAHAELIPEETVINLYGTPTLLLHGDSLCTADTDYMQFRSMVRDVNWQSQFIGQPLNVRRAIAQDLRTKSSEMNSLKAEDILDVTASEVEAMFQKYKTPLMIHGHTHRPARHYHQINNQQFERIVLGDWHDSLWYIQANPQGIELIEEAID